jgi:hypothetical protein
VRPHPVFPFSPVPHPLSSRTQRTHERARNDAQIHIPYIHRELDTSLAVLDDLERRLPLIRAQVSQVRKVYDSGRVKVRRSTLSFALR